MEADQPKKNPSEAVAVRTHIEETEKTAEAHQRLSRSKKLKKSNDPHIPVSTAKDRKTNFSKVQRKFIEKIHKEIKKLEKSIKIDIELAGKSEEIKGNIIKLTEKLVKDKRNKKLLERTDELRSLHQRLKRAELKINKERDRIRAISRALDKLRKDIPQ